MSEFTQLKSSRKAREAKRSFVTSASSTPSTSDVSGEQVTTTLTNGPSQSDVLSNESDTIPDDEKVGHSQDTTSINGGQTSQLGTSSLGVADLDGLYASIPKGIQIRVSEGTGRGLWNTVQRKPGDVLLSMKPHTAALSTEHLETYCSSCFGAGSSLKRCTSCKIVHYCDSKCQTADWTLHKQECTALTSWPSATQTESVPNDAVRCLGRLLWRIKKKGQDSVWAREFNSLQSHRTSLQKAATTDNSQLQTRLAHTLVRYLGLSSPQDLAGYGIQSAADLVDVISRFTTNTFTITSPTLTPLGACITPSVALINHSCDPNAVVVFPRATGSKEYEPQMQVIALKAISPDEEVLTSYIDTTYPILQRQQTLKETYNFICHCSLCTLSASLAYVDPRESIDCPRKCGGVCRLPTEDDGLTRCTSCKSAVKDTDAILDAVRVGQEGLEKAERIQLTDPKKALQLTRNLIPILISAGLLSSTHPLLALSRLHTSLLIASLPPSDNYVEEVLSPQVQDSEAVSYVTSGQNDEKQGLEMAQKKLDDVIRAATRASNGLSHVLVYGHPARGIALAEVGKLLAVDEPAPQHLETGRAHLLGSQNAKYPPSGPARLRLAYDTLVRARGELFIGFGNGKNEGGEVGRSVRAQLVDIEKELSVWKTGVKNAMDRAPPSKAT